MVVLKGTIPNASVSPIPFSGVISLLLTTKHDVNMSLIFALKLLTNFYFATCNKSVVLYDITIYTNSYM